jgi:hypothetical protein
MRGRVDLIIFSMLRLGLFIYIDIDWFDKLIIDDGKNYVYIFYMCMGGELFEVI